MSEYVQAWQCIGCGSIEAPQTCIGVCEHRKVQFVYAHEHQQIARELDEARREVAQLRSFLQQAAHVTPHDDAWKRSYLALQKHALRLLGDGASPGSPAPRARSPAGEAAA